MSKIISKYDIHIIGLENKRHEFFFEGNDEFFEAFEQDLIQKGHFEAKVLLDKSSTMLQLNLEILGEIELVCDKSLDVFDEPFEIREKYIFKFGEQNEQLSDEIELITFGTPTINISQHIFDFIALSIPMRKVHPRFRDDENDEESLIYQTDSEQVEEEVALDPRWAKLKNLKM